MKKRSGFSMIELVFVIVILGVLAAVAVPRFVATRTDAQVATARSDASSLLKAVVAKVFADNIDATQKCAPHPNTPASQVSTLDTCTVGDIKQNAAITWGDWMILVGGLDGKRWRVPPNAATHGAVGNDSLLKSVDAKNTIAPMGNVKEVGKQGVGSCGSFIGIDPDNGNLLFDPSSMVNHGSGFVTQSGFCEQLRDSYKNSYGNGNRIIPLASTGTVEF